MQRGKFIALNAYIRKKEKSQISNLSSHLSTQSKTNPKQIEGNNKGKSRSQWTWKQENKGKIKKRSYFFFF